MGLFSDDSPTSIIQKDLDPKKHEEIVGKLCAKRKLLEDNIHNKDNPQLREDSAIELFELKKGMVLFGVSEVDYQVYLAKLEQEKTAE